MEYTTHCPFCFKNVNISEECLDEMCECPHCKSEVCFSIEDIEKYARMQVPQYTRKQVPQQISTEFKFIIVKFDEVEEIINSLYRTQGWYVISQSTVFLGETSGGFGGFGAATREEGLALILRRDI